MINYEKIFDISKESKSLLELIFRNFGNYPINALIKMIDEIMANITLQKKDDRNYIDFYEWQFFLHQNNLGLEDNLILRFINDFNAHEIYNLKIYIKKIIINQCY